jgi:alanine transaminase
VLKQTGIAVVPGSGFRQYPGTYHFRITTLILPESKLQAKLEDFKRFNEAFHKKYADWCSRFINHSALNDILVV